MTRANSLLSKLFWFAAIWIASVAGLAIVAYAIRLAIMP